MKVIANQSVKDGVVFLDGTFLERCHVEKSIIIIEGKEEFGFAETKFVDCTLRLIGNAKRVIDTLNALGLTVASFSSSGVGSEGGPSLTHDGSSRIQ